MLEAGRGTPLLPLISEDGKRGENILGGGVQMLALVGTGSASDNSSEAPRKEF